MKWFVNITLDSEISINFRFKKRRQQKHHTWKNTITTKNSSRFGKTTCFARWWIANVSCWWQRIRKMWSRSWNPRFGESQQMEFFEKPNQRNQIFLWGIFFGEYFFYCLWGMFFWGNILFKVIFQNYRFWGRFLFVKTFSPRILRQIAPVFGSPKKNTSISWVFRKLMSWLPNLHDLGAQSKCSGRFWKGNPHGPYVDIFVGVFKPWKARGT